jgi:hypothetical protein
MTALAKRKLFLSKGEYQTCHVFVEGTQERLPAITVSQKHYSFFRTERDRERALDILVKLFDKGSDAIITQLPKAYAIWVFEPDAVAPRS